MYPLLYLYVLNEIKNNLDNLLKSSKVIMPKNIFPLIAFNISPLVLVHLREKV